MSAAQEAMDTLTAQWYNAVVAGCGLDPNTFQLFQTNQPVGTTSESLWNIFDAVPPETLAHYFNPAQINVFSSDYGGVINNLKPQNASGFLTAMGDYYAKWTAYLDTSPAMPEGGILVLFKNWSDMNMPVGQAQQAFTAYQQVAEGVVPVAVALWLAAGGGKGGTKAYNNTIDALKQALLSAPSKSFQMNSTTESSNVEHTWASGSIGGAYDIFWGSAQASWDKLTTDIATAGIEIDVQFDHLMAFTAGPLAKVSTDPILKQFEPWYSSAALNLAYQHKDNVVWNNTPPTWEDTFGAAGNMPRIAGSLIIVDGITVTTTSSAGLSTSDQETFKTAAEGGIWPFFSVSAAGGWEVDQSFDDQGNLTVRSVCPAGNPNILGAIVTPIDKAL